MKEKEIQFVSNMQKQGFPGGSVVKYLPANAGDVGLIPGSGRSSEEGNDNPYQYCLENPMDRGAWWATVHGVTTEQLSTHTHMQELGKI